MMACITIVLCLVFISGTNCTFLKFCYFQAQASYWPDPLVAMEIGDIDPFLCTHLIWAFGSIDVTNLKIVAHEGQVENVRGRKKGRLELLNDLKQINPKLKTLFSLSGSTSYVAVSRNDSVINTFSRNVFNFLKDEQFDGLGVDWLYPSRHANTAQQFVDLLTGIYAVFGGELILMTSMSPLQDTIEDAYILESIHPVVDYFVLRTTDYHSGLKVACFEGPLQCRDGFDPTRCMNWTVRHYINNETGGIPLSKIIVAISFSSPRFVLANKDEFTPGSPKTDEKREGTHYGIPGRFGYPEVCEVLKLKGTRVYWDSEQVVPYLVLEDNFVSYENEQSIDSKILWMLKLGVAGVAIWSVDLDDHQGKFCDAGKYPLLHYVDDALSKHTQKDGQLGNGGILDTAKYLFHFTSLWLFMLLFLRMLL